MLRWSDKLHKALFWQTVLPLNWGNLLWLSRALPTRQYFPMPVRFPLSLRECRKRTPQNCSKNTNVVIARSISRGQVNKFTPPSNCQTYITSRRPRAPICVSCECKYRSHGAEGCGVTAQAPWYNAGPTITREECGPVDPASGYWTSNQQRAQRGNCGY